MGRSQGGEPKASALQQYWQHVAVPGQGRGLGWVLGLLPCPWLGADFVKCSIKLLFLM